MPSELILLKPVEVPWMHWWIGGFTAAARRRCACVIATPATLAAAAVQ
jgi:hypothetical protein